MFDRRSRFNSNGFGLGQLAANQAEKDIEIYDLLKKLKATELDPATKKQMVQRLDDLYQESIEDVGYLNLGIPGVENALREGPREDYENFKKEFAEYLD